MEDSRDERMASMLAALEQMAGGDLDHRIRISPRHDELDAIAHAINVLVGELQIVAEGLRRAKEEAEAASLAKSVFLRNVSHEIRTPLSVILGMSELIALQDLPRSRVEDLRRRIVSNGRALVGILDDLLDFGKIEADKLDFHLEPVSMADAITEIVASFETDAANRGLQLRFDSAEPPPATVNADPKRLRQILTNVIGNALKFTTHGHVAVRLSRSTDGHHLWVDVTDTGIGMTKTQSRMLFEPFVQADRTIARRFGGSGLGLALSKRFAKGMGGQLDVLDSQPGVGTTFRLELPAAGANVDVIREVTSTIAVTSGAELRDQCILVVEDNEEVRATTVGLLRLAGAIVVEATDGQDALDRAQAATFHAILMDVRMPRIDGLEATRRLRAMGVTIPIVAITADAVSEQETECYNAGCSAYLTKPIHLAQLLAALQGPVPRP